MAMRAGMIFGLLLACVIGGPSVAEEDLEELAKRPGFEILKRSPDGSEILEVGKAGVVFRKMNTPTTVMGFDNSGHGAVKCKWLILTELVGFIDACHTATHLGLTLEFLEDLDRINDFIVDNELVPTTKEQVERRMKSAWFAARAQGRAAMCKSTDAEDMLELYNRTPREQRRASLDRMLSVPRPPVMNYCL